jgi:micrococcal nuclease
MVQWLIGATSDIFGFTRMHPVFTRPQLLVLTCLLAYSLRASRNEFVGRVVGITDGDTLQVLNGSSTVRVRLYGIDCPEGRQAFSAQAKQFASKSAHGRIVRVLTRGVDRYGRVVGVVILPDSGSLNEELVRAGLAWWYRKYAPRDKRLADLETEARKSKRGLWADPSPVPPWNFRSTRRQNRHKFR